MKTLEVIKAFFDLLGVNPLWGVLIIALISLKAITPWNITHKVEETEDENGKKTYKFYHYDM